MPTPDVHVHEIKTLPLRAVFAREDADAHLTDAERRAEFDVFNARLRQLVADGRLR